MRTLLWASLLLFISHLPATAEEVAECPPGPDCSFAKPHMSDYGYARAFQEGTPNRISPYAWSADMLYLNYSHNYLLSTLPRGSSPAFFLSYSPPLGRLQIDTILSLRESPVEFEIGAKYQFLDEYEGHWLSLAPRLAYNTRGNLFGGEVTASKFFIPDIWQVGMDLRFLSTGQPDGFNQPVLGMGLSTIVRVWKSWHLFGEVVMPFNPDILSQRSLIWSTGIKKRIPDTPHVLTLFVGNSQEATLSGRTIGPAGSAGEVIRAGFYFSIGIPALTEMPERLF
jgi:hypothetical protein